MVDLKKLLLKILSVSMVIGLRMTIGSNGETFNHSIMIFRKVGEEA